MKAIRGGSFYEDILLVDENRIKYGYVHDTYEESGLSVSYKDAGDWCFYDDDFLEDAKQAAEEDLFKNINWDDLDIVVEDATTINIYPKDNEDEDEEKHKFLVALENFMCEWAEENLRPTRCKYLNYKDGYRYNSIIFEFNGIPSEYYEFDDNYEFSEIYHDKDDFSYFCKKNRPEPIGPIEPIRIPYKYSSFDYEILDDKEAEKYIDLYERAEFSEWVEGHREAIIDGFVIRQSQEECGLAIAIIGKNELEEKRKLEKSQAIWHENFEELKCFLKENDNAYPDRGTKLRTWCSLQRNRYKKHELSQERIDKLNSIGFVWDLFIDAWDNSLEELKCFLKENNNAYPNWGTRLGAWCSVQRNSHKKHMLSQERVDKLNSIGFVWKKENSQAIWDNSLEELKCFLKENNNVYPYRVTKLGAWCGLQRVRYNKNELSQERIDKLNSINFKWDIYIEEWDNSLEELKCFLKEQNTYPLSTTKLGAWCSLQRSRYIKNKLSQERIDKLNSIGFVWNMRKY